MKPSAHRIAAALALLAGAAALAVNVFAHLGSPLLWYDEAETAVFGQRILTYGYPKVHDRGVVFYNINLPLETGRKESIDAYIGTPWAHFYVAAAGELFARRATDLHERTARVRLPFAATGVAGVFLIAVALAPAAAAGGAARAVFVGAYLALATLSTFLVLHLREARYYPLVVFEVGLLLVVHLRHAAYGRGRRGAYTALVATLLVALFLTFYPMCAAAAAALAVDAVRRARRAGGGWRARGRAAAAESGSGRARGRRDRAAPGVLRDAARGGGLLGAPPVHALDVRRQRARPLLLPAAAGRPDPGRARPRGVARRGPRPAAP